MQLDYILSISGRPVLVEMEAQSRCGIVARALVDGKRVTTSVNNQVSVLSEIQIYCIGTEVPLAEVFESKAFESSGASSVSVFAASLAFQLGAKRIALTGQDLSFKDRQYAGSNMKNEDSFAPNKKPIELPGYYGGTVKSKYDYVFTSGGIGPTHDDITSKSVAKAFGQKLVLNKEAKELLQKHLDYTKSPKATEVLKDWSKSAKKFIKGMPTDYKRALEIMAKKQTEKIV